MIQNKTLQYQYHIYRLYLLTLTFKGFTLELKTENKLTKLEQFLSE